MALNDIRAYADRAIEYHALYDAAQHNDTLVLIGHNCSMKVRDGALHIQPGSVRGESNEPLMYFRGTTSIKQILITSNSGFVTLDSLYWCRDQGISLLMLDGNGNQVYSITPENKDSAILRRLQYCASGSDVGAKIAHELVHQKVISQYETVSRHTELHKRDKLLKMLEHAEWEIENDHRLLNIDYLRLYEGRLALAYFHAFVGLPIKWGVADSKKVPPHWKKITPRISPIAPNGNARHAVCPFHTVLNYLYAVTEHHLLVSIHQVGFDPACAFLHSDKENRNSLVYDLIEPFRAQVDDEVLTFFQKTVFRKGDMLLLRSGQVLLNAELARHVLSSCKVPVVDGIVRWLKATLLGLPAAKSLSDNSL